jgi:hypothetical protein
LASCTTTTNQRVWAKVGAADAFDLSATKCTVDCGTAQRAYFEGAARDGSRVFFTTEQKLVDADQDTATKNDLYEYDFDAPSGSELVAITATALPDGAGVKRVVRVSEDGSHVYFVASGRPLAGENARGQTPLPGDNNLYVYHREPGETGSTTFVAALDPADSDLWGPDVRRRMQLEPTGRYVVFGSVGDLTGDRLPGDAREDLFRYDAENDDLRRIWVDDPLHNGADRTGGSVLNSNFGQGSSGGQQKNWRMNSQMTRDGSMIGFTTSEPLSIDDDNNQPDAYLWREETGEITMLTDGRSAVPSVFGSITPSGNAMAVHSASPLVKAHTSGSVAAYLIRKGGGFPDAPPPPAPCGGDGCQGPESPAAGAFTAPGSAVFAGRGNAKPSRESAVGRVSVAKTGTVRGSSTRIKVRVPGKGRIRVLGTGLSRVSKVVGKAGPHRVAVKLSRRGRATLARDGRLRVSVTVRFVSAQGRSSQARVTVTFRKKQTSRSVRRATALFSDSRKGR